MQEWDCAKMARRDREFSRTRGDQGRELSGALETLAGGACWAQGFRVTLSEVQPHSAPQAMCWGKPGSLFVLSTSGPRELQQLGLFPQVAEAQAAFIKSDTSRQTAALFPLGPRTQLCGLELGSCPMAFGE